MYPDLGATNIVLPRSYFGTFRTPLAVRPPTVTATPPRTATTTAIQRTFGIRLPFGTRVPLVRPVSLAPVSKAIVAVPKPLVSVKPIAAPSPIVGGGSSGTPLVSAGASADDGASAGESAVSSVFDFKKSPMPLILIGLVALFALNRKR